MKEEEKKESEQSKKPAKSTTKTCCIIAVIIFVLFVGLIILLNVINSVANKASNNNSNSTAQKTSEPTPDPTPAVPKEDLLDYFLTVSFNSGTPSSNTTKTQVCHWEKSLVTVELQGNYPSAAPETLNKYIDAFNKTSNTTKLSTVTSGGDIKFSFQSRQALVPIIDPSFRSESIYAWTHNDGSCNMSSSTIYIQSDINPTMLSYYTLGHELSHAMGFSGHDPKPRGCNFLTDVPCGPATYFTPYDTFAIKAMYDIGLPTCSTKSFTTDYINAHWPE